LKPKSWQEWYRSDSEKPANAAFSHFLKIGEKS